MSRPGEAGALGPIADVRAIPWPDARAPSDPGAVSPAPGRAGRIEAVQATQQQILAKLEELKKDIASKPAAPAAAARPQADPNKVYEIPVASSAVRGPKDAPVTITMFSDFQCPFCAQSQPIVEEVLKAYPKDVNFVMKQFPLRQIHPNADPAARAALAAG